MRLVEAGVFGHVLLERDFDWLVMGGVSRGMPRNWNIVHLRKFQRSFFLVPIYLHMKSVFVLF